MNIQPYILNEIKIPQFHTPISEVLKIFDVSAYSHLPVLQGDIYMGSIPVADARIFEPQQPVEEVQYALEGFFVRDTDNWIDVLHNFSKNDANLMPVLDENNQFLGYLELQDIMNLFTESPFLNNPGSIIVVEKGIKDYSFSEICQIVESNGTHVLGAFVSGTENDRTQITLKTGSVPLNAIFQTFRRYGYEVISQHPEDSFSSNLQDRSRYLDKYLNI
ncbi:acetoin utilization protein acuB [Salinimicrobium sp. MT39]|uniref:Acetoin utilization protein acuB n=1 Tax=Salinimicrobium profundisediminis TaxID=2994553 RepID=A0A9X3HZR8_9FLAO|nr:CBS domain-containing protein [Salinimicrobium profundisediminis]MCX2837230.1 acetoin utilization protein acuB [Salinimicrobium profundisediminis]